MISDLKKLGFKESGEWELNKKYKSGINMILNQSKNQRVIYCFVVDSIIKYIGICDGCERTLEDRMKRYRSRTEVQKNETGTSLKINLKIKESLKKRKSVKIYTLKPTNYNDYKGLEVDFVRGLEYPLINKYDTPWNIQGKIK